MSYQIKNSFLTVLLFSVTLIHLDRKLVSDASNSDDITLFDFSKVKNLDDWLIINDGVMGGLSNSNFALSNHHTAIFSGVLRLENNGGFASTRSKAMQLQLDGFKGIQVRVKGDGNKYQFRIRTNNQMDGVAYRYHFETIKNQWQTITIPFIQCIPVFRGQILRNLEDIKPNKIQQMGILISDKQSGEFQLEIEWIKAYQ